MRVVGISDLHGRLPNIPACDVLLIAGDICPDFMFRKSVTDIARLYQMDWLRDVYAPWEQTVSATHILATPGNHDWVKEFPPECRSKMFIDEGCNVQDLYRDRTLKFWFTPWVSGLPMWNYSLTRERRRDRFDMIPRGLDVLVSHAPAYHIGDKTMSGEHAGCIELRTAIDRARPKHCFYGHIHEGQRQGQKHVPFGQTQMHNVSMWLAETEPVEITL